MEWQDEWRAFAADVGGDYSETACNTVPHRAGNVTSNPFKVQYRLCIKTRKWHDAVGKAKK